MIGMMCLCRMFWCRMKVFCVLMMVNRLMLVVVLLNYVVSLVLLEMMENMGDYLCCGGWCFVKVYSIGWCVLLCCSMEK